MQCMGHMSSEQGKGRGGRASQAAVYTVDLLYALLPHILSHMWPTHRLAGRTQEKYKRGSELQAAFALAMPQCKTDCVACIKESVPAACCQEAVSMHVYKAVSLVIAAQHSTAQHSTAQHSTAQHSAAQPSPAQPSAAQRRHTLRPSRYRLV